MDVASAQRARPRFVGAREVAARLAMSERNVFRMVAARVLPPRGDAGWDLDACERRYLDHLVALALVRGVRPEALGIDERRAIRVLRSLALVRGVRPEALGLSKDAAPWDLGAPPPRNPLGDRV